MSDSIERLFPVSPAGSSKPGRPQVVADDEQASTPRSVRPIPASLLDSILDHRPANLYDRMAANDREYRETERRAMGGRIGFGIMVFVCIFLGLLLATGGQL